MQSTGRVVACCPDCSSPLDDGKPSELAPVKTESAVVRVTPVAIREEADVLSIAKRRLASIEVDIATLRKLEIEADMLRRMIFAAEPAAKDS